MIDTLKLASRLEAAGFTREQAQGQATALAEFIDQSAATKTDLELVKLELKADIEKVKSWTASVVIGVGVAQTVIIAVLLKYLR